MNIVYVYADNAQEWNSSEWRVAIPLDALNRTRRHRGYSISYQDWVQNGFAARMVCQNADVIVVQRNIFPECYPAIEFWRHKAGKIVVADLDDGYHHLTPDNIAYRFWIEGLLGDGRRAEPRPIDTLPQGLAMCNLVTAPAPQLVRDWEATHKARLVPNYADVRRYTRFVRERKDDEYHVLWGGSVTHLLSFTDSGILYALARVFAKRPKARFVFCGSDVRVLHSLPIRPEQVIHKTWIPHWEWPGTLVNVDLALSPLAGEYDRRRSWIKPLEYSLCGVPWIASDNTAYDGLGEFGAIVPNTVEAWVGALEDAMDSPPNERQIRRAKNWALDQDIFDNIDKVCNTYAEGKA